MTNLEAIENTIAALRAAGRLEKIDDALVTACRQIAAALDVDPGTASLWREYRAFEARLRSSGEGVGDDDLTRALAALSTPVGDTAES